MAPAHQMRLPCLVDSRQRLQTQVAARVWYDTWMSDPVSTFSLPYAPAPRRRRVWRWIRPGSPLFFVLIFALAAGGTWVAWKSQLRRDQQELQQCTSEMLTGPDFAFAHAPTRGALRQLARFPGTCILILDWPISEAKDGAAEFAVVKLPKVTKISVGKEVDADALIKTLASPASGFTSLTTLDLRGAHVTDASVVELRKTLPGLVILR